MASEPSMICTYLGESEMCAGVMAATQSHIVAEPSVRRLCAVTLTCAYRLLPDLCLFVYARRMSAGDAILTNARAVAASFLSAVTSASACSWVSAMYSA